jgi:hypothetical protein
MISRAPACPRFAAIQLWVPDVRAPAFRAKAHRQSLTAAKSAQTAEDQAFIDAALGLGR